MKTAILVHGPDFACSENLTRAFALRGNVTLVSIHPSDWRDYDPGLLVHDEETLMQARRATEEADLVFLGDATAFFTLAKLSPFADWPRWARSHHIVAFFGDSAYHKHPLYYDGLCLEINVNRLFLLPNLLPLSSLEAVPLHHPMQRVVSNKASALTVMHAPGRDGKAAQKGTNEIEAVVKELQEEIVFDYRRLSYLTLEECLAIKATAHVVIDQLPPAGLPSGLGRTGLEALAASSAVLSRMYDASVLDGYFSPPPVINARDGDELKDALRALLTDGELLKERQELGMDWVAENVEFEPWLRYVEKYL